MSRTEPSRTPQVRLAPLAESRMLDLPQPIQQAVAAGTIPVRVIEPLLAMATVSEAVACACVVLVVNGVCAVDELEERPERVIGCLGDYEWPDPQPLALAVSSHLRYPLESLPLPQGCDDIPARVAALGMEVGFRFGHEEADAARRCGCLLVCTHDRVRSYSFITDPAFIAGRVRLQLDQLERQAKPDHDAGRERDSASTTEAPAA